MTTAIEQTPSGAKTDDRSDNTKELWWGIIGAGPSAVRFATDLAEAPHSTLGGVAGYNREGVEALTTAHADAVGYPSVEALISSPDIDVVYVATPNDTHSELAIRCLEAGKPVLVEAPIARSAAEAHCIAAAARATGTFCMEAMRPRFLPIIAHARLQLELGALGCIKMIRAELGEPVASACEETHSDPSSSGGATLNLGVYAVSLVHLFLGAPRTVRSTATFSETGSDEQMCGVLTYDNAVATVAASHCAQLSNSITIYGTIGRMEIGPLLDGATTTCEVHSTAASVQTPSSRTSAMKSFGALPLASWLTRSALRRDVRTVTRRFEGHGYRAEIDEVVRCLAGGQRESAIMPLEASIEVMEVLDQIRATWQRRH